MTADISKMFGQILVDLNDIDLQRIVFLRGKSRQLLEYHLLTVSYGIAESSFSANRVLKQFEEGKAYNFPDIVVILKSDFCVDDVLFGSDNLD